MTTKDERVEWSFSDHLRHGEAMLSRIASLANVEGLEPRICFHLKPLELDDDEPWSVEASFCQRAKPLFEKRLAMLDVDYVGGTSGIEAWEDVMPSLAWLHERVPALLALASDAGMLFDGWSFEPKAPRDFSFLSCGPTLQVFNANSPEGQEAIQALIADSDASVEEKGG